MKCDNNLIYKKTITAINYLISKNVYFGSGNCYFVLLALLTSLGYWRSTCIWDTTGNFDL